MSEQLASLINNPIWQGWSSAIRSRYLVFTQHLWQSKPVTVKVGKGGLSYSTPTTSGPVFVCHYNAKPRHGSSLEFADFRLATLVGRLNLRTTLKTLRHSVPADVVVKVSVTWCALHFPPERALDVADIFLAHIILKVK